MRLNKSQSHHLADWCKDTAIGVLIALVIGGSIEKTIGAPVIVAGILLYVILLILAIKLRKKG